MRSQFSLFFKQEGYLFIYLFIYLFLHLFNMYWASITFQRLLRHWNDKVKSDMGHADCRLTIQYKEACKMVCYNSGRKVICSEGYGNRSGTYPRLGVAREYFSEAGGRVRQVGRGDRLLLRGFWALWCCPMFPPISLSFFLQRHIE